MIVWSGLFVRPRGDEGQASRCNVMFFPECPHCGNLCGRLAQRCYQCGTKLYMETKSPQSRRVPVLDYRPRRDLRSRALTAADQPGEAVPPTNGTEA